MTDEEILQELGLTAQELTDLLRKVNEFANTLNHKERRAFTESLKSTQYAAQEFGQDVTPERLTALARRLCPQCDIALWTCRIGFPPPPIPRPPTPPGHK